MFKLKGFDLVETIATMGGGVGAAYAGKLAKENIDGQTGNIVAAVAPAVLGTLLKSTGRKELKGLGAGMIGVSGVKIAELAGLEGISGVDDVMLGEVDQQDLTDSSGVMMAGAADELSDTQSEMSF